jgi:hypothetical protein
MKRLALSFRTSDGSTRTFYLNDPVDPIDASAVQTLMNHMLGVIVPSDWQVDRAAVIDTNTNELFDLIQ